MDLKRIIISSLLIASVTSATSCNSDFFAKKSKSSQESTPAKQMVYAPELDPDVHELITDQRFKSLENEEPLRFETAVTPEEAESNTPVELRDDSGKTISKMYDDGTHSDRIAGDGIYTCSYQPKASGETSYSYKAKIGNFETEPASVRYFDKITEKDVEDMKEISQEVTDIEAEYLDNEGYIPDNKKEEVFNKIDDYFKKLQKNGEAIEYRINKKYDNAIVKLSSGISCVYSNPSKDSYSGSGGDNQITIKKYVEFDPDIDPTHDSYLVRDDSPDYEPEVLNSLNNSGLAISSRFSNVTDTEITRHVSPADILSFGSNQVILWQGHGGYDPIIHSYLCTHCTFNPDDYEEADIVEDKLLVELKNSSEVRISSEYIDAHCPDMTNSLILTTTCNATTDSVLAASFMNKNCNVFVGFNESVSRHYADQILETTMLTMCQKVNSEFNLGSVTDIVVSVALGAVFGIAGSVLSSAVPVPSSTDSNDIYYSVSEALNKAKKEHGSTDKDYINAKALIFGNRSYRFADAISDDLEPPLSDAEAQGRGSFTLENYHYSIKVGETIQVKTLTRPMGAGELEWAIDNSKIATIDEDGNVTGVSSDVLDKDGNVISSSSAITTGHVVTEDGKYRQDFSITVTP